MTLRCIKLSKIWDSVFGRMLMAISPVDEVTLNQTTFSPNKAAHETDRTRRMGNPGRSTCPKIHLGLSRKRDSKGS
jgi:hypothetical protein